MKKGILLVLGTALISGVSIFINKFGVSVGTASAFTFLKNITVALLLFSLILTGKKWLEIKKLNYKNWLLLVVIGLIGGSIPFVLFFKGLAMTTAAQGSLIQKAMFIFIAVLAVAFLKEKISWRYVLGVSLIFGSNLLLLKKMNVSFGTGDWMILGATILWAIENVISKKTLRNLSGSVVAWGRMFFGALFIFAYLLSSGEVSTIHNLSLNQIGWIMLTSVLLFGYVFTWYLGLKKIPVSLAAGILLFGSAITTLLSLIQTGKFNQVELISVSVAISGLLILIKPFFSEYAIKESEKKQLGT